MCNSEEKKGKRKFLCPRIFLHSVIKRRPPLKTQRRIYWWCIRGVKNASSIYHHHHSSIYPSFRFRPVIAAVKCLCLSCWMLSTKEDNWSTYQSHPIQFINTTTKTITCLFKKKKKKGKNNQPNKQKKEVLKTKFGVNFFVDSSVEKLAGFFF